MGWQPVILAGLCLAGVALVLWWIAHREGQAKETQALRDQIVELVKERDAFKNAWETSEKAREVAREGGGPDRVRDSLDRLPKIGES